LNGNDEMKNHSSKLLLVLIVLLITLTAYKSIDSLNKKTIMIGANQWIGYESLHLYGLHDQKNEKMFKVVEFSSSVEVMQAFKKNLIQVAALTLDEAILLSHDIEDLTVFLILDVSAGGDAILTLSKNHKIKDLEKGKVGLETGSVGTYLLFRAAELFHLDMNKMKLISIPFENQEKALLNGHVDFLVTFNPVKSKLMEKGSQVLFDSNSIPGEIVDVLVARKSVINENKKLFIDLSYDLQQTMVKISLRDHDILNTISMRNHLPLKVIEGHINDIKIPIGKNNSTILKRIFESTIHKLEKAIKNNSQYYDAKNSNLNVDFSIVENTFKLEQQQ